MNIISKNMAQQIVDSVKEVSGQNINFINSKGIIIASTDPERIGSFHEIGYQVVQGGSTLEVANDDSFYGTKKGINIPILYNGAVIAAIGISGEPEQIRKYAFLAQKITLLLLRERELNIQGSQKKQRTRFLIRSLIRQENLNQAYFKDVLQEYHLTEDPWVRLVLVKLNNRYNPSNLFMIQQDIYHHFEQTIAPFYTYEYPNEYILVLQEKNYKASVPILEKMAAAYPQMLTVSVGKREKLLKLYRSYESARLAANCKLHDEQIICYDDLDYELLLGDVSVSVREQFLSRVIGKLDDTDCQILQTYFAENMSLQRTAEVLYMHKNSLQYKLNRIHTRTGYNPRVFQDAVTLHSALRLRQLFEC